MSKTKYQAYLESKEWKALSGKARDRDGKCVFCGDDIDAVHHVRYPKVLGSESLDDLISVCKICHDKCHGLNITKESKPIIPYSETESLKSAGRLAELNYDFIVKALSDRLRDKSNIAFDTISGDGYYNERTRMELWEFHHNEVHDYIEAIRELNILRVSIDRCDNEYWLD